MLENMYKVQDFIWHTLRCYSPVNTSIGMVTMVVVGDLEEAGCHATVTDKQHRDFRIIEVDNHQYRIQRGKHRFDPFDVRIIA